MNPLDQFVVIPEVTFSNGHVEPSFQAGVYYCSKGVSNEAVINPNLVPWTNLKLGQARIACVKSGYSLMTYDQSMAISVNLAENDLNWTGGKVYQGLRDPRRRGCERGSYEGPNHDENRFFILSNGEIICDAAGNIYHFTDNTASVKVPTKYKECYYPYGGGCNSYELLNPDGPVIRGGHYSGGSEVGLFKEIDWRESGTSTALGFRCVKPI